MDADGDDVAERVVGDEVARVANHAEAVVGVGDGDEQVLLARDFEETQRFFLRRAERRLTHHVEAMLWVRRGGERNFEGEETDGVVEVSWSGHADEVDALRFGKFTLALDHLFIAVSEKGTWKGRFVYAVSMNTILRSANLALLRVGGETATDQFCTSPESSYNQGMGQVSTSRQMERPHHRSNSSANHSHSVHGTRSDLLVTVQG